MIKAIIFDFGNVIFSFDNDIFRQRMGDLIGKTKEEIKQLVYKDSDLVKRFETGLVSGQEFFEELCLICEIKIPYEELKEMYSGGKFSPVEGTVDLIEKLQKKYKIGLLSNISEWDFDEVLRVAPIVKSFDTITTSFEVKAMKPNPEIFLDALNKLNLKPEECVYTDDILEYVEAAKKIGIKAFQFTGAQNFELDLKKLGLQILP